MGLFFLNKSGLKDRFTHKGEPIFYFTEVKRLNKRVNKAGKLTQQVFAYIEMEQLEQIRKIAQEEERTVTSVVKIALKEYLEKRNKQKGE